MCNSVNTAKVSELSRLPAAALGPSELKILPGDQPFMPRGRCSRCAGPIGAAERPLVAVWPASLPCAAEPPEYRYCDRCRVKMERPR